LLGTKNLNQLDLNIKILISGIVGHDKARVKPKTFYLPIFCGGKTQEPL
jgi:hypothetical protein